MGVHEVTDLIDVDRPGGLDLKSQRIGYLVLVFFGGKLKDTHIQLVSQLFDMSRVKHVVSDSKLARGKHLFPIPVVCKRARLANKRINHVAIINRHSFLSKESIHRLNRMILVRYDDLFRLDSHIDSASNQPTGDRVRVGSHQDRATLGDSNT